MIMSGFKTNRKKSSVGQIHLVCLYLASQFSWVWYWRLIIVVPLACLGVFTILCGLYFVNEKYNFKPNFDPLHVTCLLFLAAFKSFPWLWSFIVFLKNGQICIFSLKIHIFLQLWKIPSLDFSKHFLPFSIWNSPGSHGYGRKSCRGFPVLHWLSSFYDPDPSSFHLWSICFQQLHSEVNGALYSLETLFSSFLKMKYSMF